MPVKFSPALKQALIDQIKGHLEKGLPKFKEAVRDNLQSTANVYRGKIMVAPVCWLYEDTEPVQLMDFVEGEWGKPITFPEARSNTGTVTHALVLDGEDMDMIPISPPVHLYAEVTAQLTLHKEINFGQV